MTHNNLEPTDRRRFLRRCMVGGATWALTGSLVSQPGRAADSARLVQGVCSVPEPFAPEPFAPDPSVFDLSVLESSASAQTLASDENYWHKVRQLYPVPDSIIHLEHGNWGMMSHGVLAHYEQELARVNRSTSYYGRQDFAAEEAAIMQQLATWLDVDPAELVLVRNATEALSSLIGGYNKLQPGDSVLYADLDYPSMQGLLHSRWYTSHFGIHHPKEP